MRRSEAVLAAYFGYTSVLAVALDLRGAIRMRTLAVNAALALVYAVLLRTRGERLERARDFLPLPLMLLAYKQMGWFAPQRHAHRFEPGWIAWDRLALGEWGGRAALEALGPVLPWILELSYLVVYALPLFTVVALYRAGRRERVDSLLVVYLLGLFLSYIQFPFWPSEPPRLVYPDDNLPQIDSLFRRFNLWLLGGYGIHTSVFPSAHVSGAIAAALGLRTILPERPGLWRGVMVYAVLVSVATVYGRYHYLVDALAGLAVGAVAAWLGKRMIQVRTIPRQPAMPK